MSDLLSNSKVIVIVRSSSIKKLDKLSRSLTLRSLSSSKAQNSVRFAVRKSRKARARHSAGSSRCAQSPGKSRPLKRENAVIIDPGSPHPQMKEMDQDDHVSLYSNTNAEILSQPSSSSQHYSADPFIEFEMGKSFKAPFCGDPRPWYDLKCVALGKRSRAKAERDLDQFDFGDGIEEPPSHISRDNYAHPPPELERDNKDDWYHLRSELVDFRDRRDALIFQRRMLAEELKDMRDTRSYHPLTVPEERRPVVAPTPEQLHARATKRRRVSEHSWLASRSTHWPGASSSRSNM